MGQLSYDETYRCPACGTGKLSAIALMDVFACSFCHHFFTANLDTQSIQLADRRPTRSWQWQGNSWRVSGHLTAKAGLIWTFVAILIAIPPSIIALSNYIFPPLEASAFPQLWLGLTLLSHSAIALWLLAEYHQWPWYLASGIRLRRWRESWNSDAA